MMQREDSPRKGAKELTEETRQEVQLPILWAGTEDINITFVNQFLGQVGLQNDVILTLGQLTPPALLGTPEQQREQAKEIPFISVRPVVRIGLTKAGLDQLVEVLQQTQQNYEHTQERIKQLTEEGDEE